MLKGIPSVISPDLMSVLMRMGHGDDLVLADGNFPAESHARHIVRADGHGVMALLRAILPFFPLDTFVEHAALVMQPVDPQTPEPPLWSDFRSLLTQSEDRPISVQPVERFRFYDLAKSSFAIVATGESAAYANLILRKGVVTQ